MTPLFIINAKDKKTLARAGVINTPHGKILTPAFSPVATRASVRSLGSEDLVLAKTQVILANTYHLYLKPGGEVLKKFGGFAPFMGWRGPTITDSGGYQVSFLWTKGKNSFGNTNREFGKVVSINNKGASFRSYFDGKIYRLTPELSMEIQSILGADIIMAFDQPLGEKISIRQAKEAFVRTLKWEERSFIAWQKREQMRKNKDKQFLYGIIQGGTDKKLRLASLDFVLNLGFPGIALGGETIGADPKITEKTLMTLAGKLPDQKPVHALGLGGGPEGILTAVEYGIDTFDNTGITRMARCGLLFISPRDGGKKANKFRLDITKKLYSADKKPIGKTCGCFTCGNYSRAYLHHLFATKELLGLKLATVHNIHFVNNFMEQTRVSIINGDFAAFKNHWL